MGNLEIFTNYKKFYPNSLCCTSDHRFWDPVHGKCVLNPENMKNYPKPKNISYYIINLSIKKCIIAYFLTSNT